MVFTTTNGKVSLGQKAASASHVTGEKEKRSSVNPRRRSSNLRSLASLSGKEHGTLNVRSKKYSRRFEVQSLYYRQGTACFYLEKQ